ncbi:hypothetical protein D3C78_1523700 [compost metagenome]
MSIDFPFSPQFIVLGINRHNNTLGAKATSSVRDQLRIQYGCRVNPDFVSTSPQNTLHILHLGDASTNCERNRNFPGSLLDDFNHRSPTFI